MSHIKVCLLGTKTHSSGGRSISIQIQVSSTLFSCANLGQLINLLNFSVLGFGLGFVLFVFLSVKSLILPVKVIARIMLDIVCKSTKLVIEEEGERRKYQGGETVNGAT